MRETLVLGPPGTGKTTYLSRQVERAAEAVGGDHIMVASFTKAAARELINRELPVTPESVGTLHALAYRVLGRPELVDGHLREWGDAHPEWSITNGAIGNIDEDSADGHANEIGDGDRLYRDMENCRARMIPRDQWPGDVSYFAKTWEDWKRATNRVDFTDLIERCVAEEWKPPGDPRIGFFDEVQDFTKLELALVRSWGRRMDRIILAGDDDQCLYSFKGATPDAFLDVEDRHILGQSYRVPRAVHARASLLLERISRRAPKEYLPTDQEGEVLPEFEAAWSRPEFLIDHLEKYVADGLSVMILASTSYFLRPTIAVLREGGLPFHNPYRRIRGDWNPLAVRGGAVSSAVMLNAFLSKCPWNEFWTVRDFLLWIKQLKVEGCLVPKLGRNNILQMEHQVEQERAEGSDYEAAPAYDARKILTPAALEKALARDLDWFCASVKTARVKGMAFPLQVLRQRGRDVLAARPKIIVGTIHSVKGGEADVVAVFPDLSPAGGQEYHGSPQERDSVLRLFYVGMTRAKQKLILCRPSGHFGRPSVGE